MKKLFLKSSLVALFIGLTSFILTETPTVPEQKSLLWKISGKDLKQPSYLFGTMHLIQKDCFYFPSKLQKIIKNSDAIVMEIAHIDQANAMPYLTLKEGSLFDYFNQAQTDSLYAWVKQKMGMDSTTFRKTMGKMKPFVVIQMATQMQYMGKTASYEQSITELANEKNIQQIGLETIVDQISIFDNLPKEKMTDMVMETIRGNGDDSEAELKKMQELYKNQYLDSLNLYITSRGGVISEEQDAFLVNRNKNWIPKIEKIIHDHSAFIAVGAGHLGGNEGVIKLLQNAGYTVTPVKF